MKAISLVSPGVFSHVEADPPPPPGPGEALVRTRRMGVCGTDIHAYSGTQPLFSYPRILGHELGVEVLAVGEGVTHVKAGDRCAVEPYMNCGVCAACRKGSGNCCVDLKVIGVMADGGLRERFTVRADKLHPSSKLTYDALALVETLAIGRHAVNRAAPAPGETVLIVGAGPIGLAALIFAKIAGARTLVLDIDPGRLRFCRDAVGADALLEPGDDPVARLRAANGGESPDVVVDATGNAASMSAAFGYTAPTGRLVYVGLTRQPVTLHQPVFHRTEGTLLCSRNALPEDFRSIIRLMEDGRVDIAPWITHRTTFGRFTDDFPAFTRPGSGVVKAVVELD